MSLNKFMHPRNIYRTPPDFTQLALDYADFRNAGSLNIKGKFYVDFQDANAIRTLTKCLLDRDFSLQVHLPADKLVPTLPLRLNYILWLEDIVKVAGRRSEGGVIGVDIGCGASCVYPLLAVRHTDWTMFGLESNEDSAQYARENVARNHLDHRITIVQQQSESPAMFKALFESYPSAIDFCMCNPPFFGSVDELQLPAANTLGKRNRTGKRRPAKCAQTGSNDELFVNGGEFEFVRRIIDDSCALEQRIRVYTTMLGHKASVALVLDELRRRGISNVCTTQFCQGHTMRWGVGWSFDATIPLRSVLHYGPSTVKTNDPRKSYRFVVSSSSANTISDMRLKLVAILQSIDLEIHDSNLVSDSHWSGKVVAHQNTWSNNRRRRRKLQHTSAIYNNVPDHTSNISESSATEPLLVATLNLFREHSKSQSPPQGLPFGSIIDVEYVSGTGNRDAANQLMTFIQHQWK